MVAVADAEVAVAAMPRWLEQVARVRVVHKRLRLLVAPVDLRRAVAPVAFQRAEAADKIASGIAEFQSRPAPRTRSRAATTRTTWKRESCQRCS